MPNAVRQETASKHNEGIRRTSTTAALGSSAFRLYFAGQLVSVSGTWMQTVAQQVVVYELTKSELALGTVALAQGLPALILTPFAGVIVESFPRRQILVFTQAVMMTLALILAVLQFTGTIQLWHLIMLSFGVGCMNALDAPARQSFIVEMVGREQLTSGIVMNSIMFNTSRIIGPALGGIALKVVGPAWCFFLNGLSFLAVLASLVAMVVPAPRKLSGKFTFMKPLMEGLRFARHHPTIGPLLIMSLTTSLFGVTFVVLLPSYADLVLHDTSGGTAVLLTAQGVGAILAGLFVARYSGTGKGGKVLSIFAIAGPLSVILFALTRTLVMALLPIAGAGLFLIGQFIMTNTLIQTVVPDEFRSRVMSLYTLTFFGFNPFAALAIGALAEQVAKLHALALPVHLYTLSISANTPLDLSARAAGTADAMLVYGLIALVGSALILWRNPQVRALH
jgi:MFS family permease